MYLLSRLRVQGSASMIVHDCHFHWVALMLVLVQVSLKRILASVTIDNCSGGFAQRIKVNGNMQSNMYYISDMC